MKRDKFDRVVSDLVREAAGRCQLCGRTDVRLENMHIYGRRHAKTRYDLDNMLSGCHSCHRDMTENPVIFSNWLTENLGNGFMQILAEKKNTIQRWKTWEKDEMYEHYKSECKPIRAGGSNPLSYQ